MRWPKYWSFSFSIIPSKEHPGLISFRMDWLDLLANWFQIRKGICQGYIFSPSLFNFYAENIKRNAGLEEAQAGIKIAGRNISNLRHADDTTLMQKVKRN